MLIDSKMKYVTPDEGKSGLLVMDSFTYDWYTHSLCWCHVFLFDFMVGYWGILEFCVNRPKLDT